jgi:hypothetical protein
MKINRNSLLILALIIASLVLFTLAAIRFGPTRFGFQDIKAIVGFSGIVILGCTLVVIGDMSQKTKAFAKQMVLQKIGNMVFINYDNEFKAFHDLYLNSKKNFHMQAADLLINGEGFDLKNLQPAELLYLFANSKKLAQIIDWRGEENEGEILEFIEQLSEQRIAWTNTTPLRAGLSEVEQRDGKFIIKLFRSINKDLKAVGYQLMFFDLQWDAYVYMLIPAKTFGQYAGITPEELKGIVKLRI